MDNKSSIKNINFLPGGGEMGNLIRQKNWSETSVGNPETWSQSLRTTLSIMLNSKFPMFLLWGPDLVCFYNDAYRPSLGNDGKHPIILGNRGEDFLQEVWGNIKPLIDHALAGGETDLIENQLFPIFRNNKMEDAYWTFSYSAVNDESGKPAGVFISCVETTKQIKALKNLEESQEKLKFAIDAANLGTWNLNLVTNKFIYNQQLRNWYGLDPEAEIDVSTAVNAVSEKDRQKVIDAMAAAMTPGSDGNYEVQHSVISKFDKKERIVLAKGKALFDENGEVYRFSGTGQDITEEVTHRQSEEEKNIFTQLILESNPDCVKIIDPCGKITYMNENGVCVLEGDNKAYFIDRTWETMWAEKEQKLIRDAVQRAFKGETINFQAPANTVKGNLKWWDVIVTALPNNEGEIKELLAVSRDITELKKTENKLIESEEQLRFALEGGNLGYFDFYPQKDVLNWSGKVRELHGVSSDKQLNLETYRNAIHPDNVEQALSDFQKALSQEGKILYENEYRTSRTNKWLSVKGKVTKDIQGEVLITGIVQDITQSKIAEKQLFESEYRFKNMIYNSPTLISILKGENFVIDIANDAILKTWGRGKEVIGKPFFEALPEYIEQGFEIILKEVYKTGIPFKGFDVPVIITPANGETELRYFTFIYQVQRDIYGVIESITIMATDVTQQVELNLKIQESEKLLRQTKEQLELTFANVPAAIFLYGDNNELLLANQRAADLLEYDSVEEMLKYKNFDLLMKKMEETFLVKYEDDTLFTREKLPTSSTLKTGKPSEMVLSMQKKIGGNKTWYLNKSAPILGNDGKVMMILTTSTDITTQKLAEETIRESENRFRTLAETLPGLIWTTDQHGNPEYASGKWGEYAGKQSLNPEDWTYMVHPDDLENINQAWGNSLATGNIYKYDVRLKSKNNEYRWFTVNGEPVFDAENKIIKWVGAFTDVHTEKSFLQELEKQVEERTKELSVAKDNLIFKNEELVKMNKELESFAYVSSHDLQEPLRKIQTFANRILEKENENLSESGKEYLRRMRIASERMQQLIQDLLAYSRTKTTDRKFESTNLSIILNDIKEDLKDEIRAKNVVIETNESCLIEVKIIAFQFRQLLYNLIGNSIKFSKANEQPVIKLFCQIAEGAKLNHQNLIPTQRYYHLTISDNGIGFKADYKEKIFEIFQRLHGREEYTGTGIGLAIVKKIIDNHNGFINANGELGLGATFDIYIPTN